MGFVLPLIAAAAGQKPQWKGKIETENGIKVIINPKDPISGDTVLNLAEELSIGNENDENYAFHKGIDFAVDKEGNVFVLDKGNVRIQKFDKNGRYLLAIGGKGRGPGEFQSVSGAFIDSRSALYISQGRTISVFDEIGRFARSIPLDTFIYSFGITSEGNVIATTSSIGRKTCEDLIFIDSTGRRVKTLASFPNTRNAMTNGVALGARNSFAPFLFYHAFDENLGVYGFSESYRFFLVDSSGNDVMVVEKEEIPEPLTEADKERDINAEFEILKQRGILIPKKEIERNYPFPAHKPFYSGFMTDDLRNIYVSKISTTKREISYDLFNRRGYYIFRVHIREPIILKTIIDGCLYAATVDKGTGYNKVKRYRIKNWDEIKNKTRFNISVPE
jgi:hypothetical protein